MLILLAFVFNTILSCGVVGWMDYTKYNTKIVYSYPASRPSSYTSQYNNDTLINKSEMEKKSYV